MIEGVTFWGAKLLQFRREGLVWIYKDRRDLRTEPESKGELMLILNKNLKARA